MGFIFIYFFVFKFGYTSTLSSFFYTECIYLFLLLNRFNKAKNDLQVEKQVQVLLQSTLQELRDQYKSQIQVIQKSTDEVKALYHKNVCLD